MQTARDRDAFPHATHSSSEKDCFQIFTNNLSTHLWPKTQTHKHTNTHKPNKMQNNTVYEKYSAQLVANPLKISNWELLLNHLISSHATPLNKTIDPNAKNLIAATYKSMLVYFPYLENYHIDYALFHHRLGEIKESRLAFQNGLAVTNNRSLLLWCEFLKKLIATEPNKRIILQNFEKAEFHIGLHFFAAPFWDLYLNFLLENKYPYEMYLRLLRKIIEIPLYDFTKYHKQWFKEIESGIKDLQDLQKIVNVPSINAKFNLDLQKIINSTTRKGYVLKDLKLKLINTFKDLYQTIEYQSFEIYQLFELPLTMYRKTHQCYYMPPNFPLNSKFLAVWIKYLDFTIQAANHSLITLNFQRCLSSANIAHLDIIWLKYAKWLIGQNSMDADYLSALDVLKQSLKFVRSQNANLKIVCKITDIYIKLNYNYQFIHDLWYAHYRDPVSHHNYDIFKKFYSYMNFINAPLDNEIILKRLVKRKEFQLLELLKKESYMEYTIEHNLKFFLKRGKFWYLYFYLIWYNTGYSNEDKIAKLDEYLPIAITHLKSKKTTITMKSKLKKLEDLRVVELWLQKYSPQHLLVFKSLC